MKKSVKKSPEGRKRKTVPLKVTTQEKLYVGVDVHKHNYQVVVWSTPRRGEFGKWTGPSQSTTITKRLEAYRSQVVKIVYEAGPTGYGLARTLQEEGWPIEVVSPAHTPVTPGDRDKSDRLDAEKLAIYASQNLLRPIYVLTEQEDHDRSIFRNRDRIVGDIRRIKNRIKGRLLYNGIPEPEGLQYWSKSSLQLLSALDLAKELRQEMDDMLSELSHLTKTLQKATRRLEELSKTERYRDRVARMTTVPGVGMLTAMAFLLEIPHLDRFESPRQIARMLGLSPQIRSSGETVRQQGRQLGGVSRVRTLLVEAAWVWKKLDPLAAERYAQLVRNTGSYKKAITGLARKLGIILWRLALDPLPYCRGLMNIPDSVAQGMIRKAESV